MTAPSVVHLTTSVAGGAGRAAARVHAALRAAGVGSTIYTANRGPLWQPHVVGFDPSQRVTDVFRRNRRRNRIVADIARYRATRTPGFDWFSDDRTDTAAGPLRRLPAADVIHLHWVTNFVDYDAMLPGLARRAPLVWTVHDLNPLTGGCHYDAGCNRFTLDPGCGACPQLGSADPLDLSRDIWSRKRTALADVPSERMHVVACSEWTARQVRASMLMNRFPLRVIPLSVDPTVFFPRDRAAARAVLGLPVDGAVVLFAADSVANRRKGFALLAAAVEGIGDDLGDVTLVSVGGDAAELPARLGGARYVPLGYVTDDRLLATAYSAADAFVIPSLQEAFGQTALEAAACGTPAVGFDGGALPEVIRDGRTGLIVPAGDVAGLRQAIVRLLVDDEERRGMGDAAVAVAREHHAPAVLAERYVDVYRTATGEAAAASNPPVAGAAC